MVLYASFSSRDCVSSCTVLNDLLFFYIPDLSGVLTRQYPWLSRVRESTGSLQDNPLKHRARPPVVIFEVWGVSLRLTPKPVSTSKEGPRRKCRDGGTVMWYDGNNGRTTTLLRILGGSSDQKEHHNVIYIVMFPPCSSKPTPLPTYPVTDKTKSSLLKIWVNKLFWLYGTSNILNGKTRTKLLQHHVGNVQMYRSKLGYTVV